MPTLATADPLTWTWTPVPVNRPALTPSMVAMPLGDVGEDDAPPQAENSVANVAPDATWQAPAQNRRRETGASVSDIAVRLMGGGNVGRNTGATRKTAGFCEPPVTDGAQPITNRGEEPAIW